MPFYKQTQGNAAASVAGDMNKQHLQPAWGLELAVSLKGKTFGMTLGVWLHGIRVALTIRTSLVPYVRALANPKNIGSQEPPFCP